MRPNFAMLEQWGVSNLLSREIRDERGATRSITQPVQSTYVGTILKTLRFLSPWSELGSAAAAAHMVISALKLQPLILRANKTNYPASTLILWAVNNYFLGESRYIASISPE